MKKLCTYSGILLALASLGVLALPLFSTSGTILRLGDLASLSPWGAVVLAAPIAALALGTSRLNSVAKSLGLLSLFLLDGVALSGAVATARHWIHNLADGFVQPHGTQWIYAATITLALACFWLAVNLPLPAPSRDEEPGVPAAVAPEKANNPDNPAEENTQSIIDVELYNKCDENKPEAEETPASVGL